MWTASITERDTTTELKYYALDDEWRHMESGFRVLNGYKHDDLPLRYDCLSNGDSWSSDRCSCWGRAEATTRAGQFNVLVTWLKVA